MIFRGIMRLQIIQQLAPFADQFQKPSPGIMVFLVDLKMLHEGIYPLGEQGNLDIRGTGILVMGFKLIYQCCLCLAFSTQNIPPKLLLNIQDCVILCIISENTR